MRKYFNSLWRLAFTSTAKSTYITTFGAGLNALFGFLFNIIVARSLAPSDFGLFSVILNLVTILFVVCDVGLSSSVLRYLPIVIKENRFDEKPKIIKFAFLSALVISGLMAILLVLFSSPVASIILTKKEIALPLVVSSFFLIGMTLTFIMTSVLQAEHKFLYGVVTDSSVIFIKFLITIFLLLTGALSLTNILIVISVTSFSGFLIGLFFLSPKFLLTKTDFGLAKTLLGFSLWVVMARIANVISSRIDAIMLIRYVQEAQVGFYTAAQRMTFLFPVMVNGLTVVITPKFAALQTKEEALSFIKKSSLMLSSLYVPLVILFVIAPWLTVQIYGEIYAPAATIFRWLIISSAFFIASSVPVTAILYFLGWSKFFALLSLLQLLLIIFGNLVLIPKYGVYGPAVSLAFAYGIIFIISVIVLGRRIKNYGQ